MFFPLVHLWKKYIQFLTIFSYGARKCKKLDFTVKRGIYNKIKFFVFSCSLKNFDWGLILSLVIFFSHWQLVATVWRQNEEKYLISCSKLHTGWAKKICPLQTLKPSLIYKTKEVFFFLLQISFTAIKGFKKQYQTCF